MSIDLRSKVVQRMKGLGLSQSEVALACGISQPHLSKVLSKKVRLASKTEVRLIAWLKSTEVVRQRKTRRTVRAVASRIEAMRPSRQSDIMKLLSAIEALLRE